MCVLSNCCTFNFHNGFTELIVIKCADCLVTDMAQLLSTLSKFLNLTGPHFSNVYS